MSLLTLLDIAVANGRDDVAGLIEESIQAHPEIEMGAVRTIKGTQYKTLVRTALPTVSFRNANEGTPAGKSTFENRLVETYILTPRFEADKAVADAYEDGPAAYIAMEASAQLEASMRLLGKQFYYGTGSDGDAKGHPGLLGSVDTELVVDAAGTAADTGSSVWAVKWGAQDVIWVYGQNGQLQLDDLRIQSIEDANGNRFDAYIQTLTAYPGMQVGSKNSIGRIKKITEEAGKTLTDDMMYDLLSKFPAGVRPDVFFMTRRSLKQLRQSRTATNATGAPAPVPTEVEGIPIAVTDSILNTEALTL
jgi:hypothetical protein